MKNKYKIHFTLSWSTVAFLALIMLACKSCTPAHAKERTTTTRWDSGCVEDQPQHVGRDLHIVIVNIPAAAGLTDTAALLQNSRVIRKS